MGNRGRFGKYGDIKRIARLRKSRMEPGYLRERRIIPPSESQFCRKGTTKRAQIAVRTANPADADYIRVLSKKVFQQYGSYEDMLPCWFESGMTVNLLALMGKRPVGFAMLGRLPDECCAPRISELLAIAVEPERQRLGIGDFLMREIVRKAEELGVDTLILHTAVENAPGRRLFKKFGFVASEIKKSFYPKGQDALMMHKDIL